MYRAIKIICSLILLISVLTLSNTTIKADSSSDVRTHYLKINYNGKVLFHEKIAEGKYIQVLNEKNEILESIVLKSDTEMELEKPEIPEGQILSYWEINQSDTKVEILPIFTESMKLQAGFISKDGGSLIYNNSKIKEIVKSFGEDVLFNDIAPEVKADDNYKFRGWHYYKDGKTLEKLNVTDTTKPTDKTEYFALFYKDINDNNLDDTTEKITLKFVPNNGQKLEDKNLYVGQPFSIPKLDVKKDHIFMGWYIDEDFKTKYDNKQPLIENTTLYGKWEKAETVIEQSENNPITDQNVSDQVESILNGRLDELQRAIERVSQNVSAAEQVPQQTQPNNVLPQPERVPQPQQGTNSNNTSEDSSNQSNEVLTYTETRYIFKNPNIGERYMIKFFDEDNRFLFSITLPYGRSIKVLDQTDNLVKEYFVRQDTTINMNVSDYVFNEADLLKFDSRTVKVNNSDITEIYPILRPIEPKIAAPITNEVEEETGSKLGGLIALGTLFILFIAGVIYYLIKRNKKMNVEIN